MMYEARKFFSGVGTQVILCISSLKSFPLIILLFTSCVEENSELSNMRILIGIDYLNFLPVLSPNINLCGGPHSTSLT